MIMHSPDGATKLVDRHNVFLVELNPHSKESAVIEDQSWRDVYQQS